MNPRIIQTLLCFCACVYFTGSGTSQNAPASDLAAQEYVKRVSEVISSMWMRELERNRDMTVAGTVEVAFRVTALGKVENLKIISNTSNEAVANTCIYVITKAQLPPIPADALKNGSPWINIHLPLTVNPPH
jgi:hypothetical protein